MYDMTKVETSADTRKKMARQFGFDEPSVTEKLNRADFGSDEEYFHACAELAVRNNSPEYRREYTKIRRKYTAQKAAEEAAEAERKHQEEIEQAIRDYVLRPEDQQRVDDEARRRAQDDLANGKISFQQMGAAVAKHAEKLTQEAKEDKVHTADINRQIREAMMEARGINSMAGTLNDNTLGVKIPDILKFKLPAVAMGTVIPPKMQYERIVDHQTVAGGVSSDDMNAILRVLTDIRSAVRDGKVIAVDNDVFGKLVYNTYNNESGRKGTSLVGVNR